jgi:hypothetical protein
MIEYHTLKLESNNNYIINNTTYALASLLSDYYKIDNLIFMEFIKIHIKNTTNPVKFLKEIENYK